MSEEKIVRLEVQMENMMRSFGKLEQLTTSYYSDLKSHMKDEENQLKDILKWLDDKYASKYIEKAIIGLTMALVPVLFFLVQFYLNNK